jgi:type II secretory pathway pseudopilin PulG
MFAKLRWIAIALVATLAAFAGGTISGTIQAQAVSAQTFTVTGVGAECLDGYKSYLIYDYTEDESDACSFEVKVTSPKTKRVVQMQYFYDGKWQNGSAPVLTNVSTGKAKVTPWSTYYDEDLEDTFWAEGVFVYRFVSAKSGSQKAWTSSNFVIEFTPNEADNSDYLDENGCIIDEEYWDDIDEMCYPL